MAKAGSCLFQIGYFLYTRTRIGYYYHRRDIAKAQEKLGGGSHSELTLFSFGDLQILPIPMMMDNYAYLVTDTTSNTSVVVDPGHAEPVQLQLSERNIMPEAILITHKHWDHSGGNTDMQQHYPGIKIYGNVVDHVQNITNAVTDAEVLKFGGLKFQVMMTPGHTIGHVVYVLEGGSFGAPDCVFSGDLLFLSGCGRMFEGSSTVMLKSLDRICSLPDSCLIWPGHEYAKENLEFTCHLDTGNSTAKEKLEWVKSQREKKLCTCPSTLLEEKQYNPFIRTAEESIVRALGLVSDDSFKEPSDQQRACILEEIRERKDQFKYKL
ncbi:probable hydrolase PNKD [Pomacea canaliculata]|uniref:probable hydrolase PNKD n=1 Tax=Pomacea canaliculata TaxID=400727 RepID=UPI000D73D747|nr:probable hydrolase PNKD [Pomacea canaliculata]